MAINITSVSGTLSNGQTITISGSGFGTKSTAKPQRWDDFEAGTVGNQLGNASNLSNDISAWILASAGEAGHEAKYSNTNVHGGSQSALSDNTGACYNASIGYDWAVPFQGVLFASWWEYRVRSSGVINWKPWRYYILSADNGFFIGNDPTTWSSWYMLGATPTQHYFSDASFIPPPDLTWDQFQTCYYSGTPGNADGYFYYWRNGKLIESRTGLAILPALSTDGWEYIRINDYWNTTPGTLQTWIDDLYIDNTQTHVFISDSASVTWPDMSTAHHSEIQIPSTWADGSITVTLNRGSFGTTDTVYLYVVDSTGAISPAKTITLGSGGLMPPTNLRIV